MKRKFLYAVVFAVAATGAATGSWLVSRKPAPPPAQAQFTEALKLRPNFALAANNLGFVFHKQEKFAEAARWFEHAIRMDPSRAIAYMNLGDAYARAGQAGKAKSAYRTYLELAPHGGSAEYARRQMERL